MIVVVADDDCINDWDVHDFAGHLGALLLLEKGE